MANLQVKDGAGSTKYLKTSGAGSDGDPHIPEHTISGNVTVTGTVAVTNADIATVAGAVSGSHMQSDVVGALPTGTNVIGATKDAGAAWTTVYTFTASADATGGADITAAPTAGQKIVITDLIVSVDTAMTIQFLTETTGAEVLRLYMPASGTVQVTPRSPLKLATADKKLRIDSSVAGNISVTAFYYSEA